MALFTTFMSTPSVMVIYKPARGGSDPAPRKLQSVSESTKDELRVLACVHGPGNVPSLINLIGSTRSTNNSRLKLYILHLVELTERSSSIVMAQRFRKNGFPSINRFRRGDLHDRVAVAFQAYGQLGRVRVRTTTAISALATMHEDICHVAENKRVTMIILPFHKHCTKINNDVVENVGHSWRNVNQRVLMNAPCSVAVLVDHGFGENQQTPGPSAIVAQRICIIFFGGPDDREALELGGRMMENPAVKVTVTRFLQKEGVKSENVTLRTSPNNCGDNRYSFSTAILNPTEEKELDKEAVAEFRRRWEGIVEYKEKVATNIVDGLLTIGRNGNYDLIVVGKARCPSIMVAELANRQAEHAELGPIGDVLASSGQGIVSSVLVIQQHYITHTEEAPVSKIIKSEDNTITSIA